MSEASQTRSRVPAWRYALYAIVLFILFVGGVLEPGGAVTALVSVIARLTAGWAIFSLQSLREASLDGGLLASFLIGLGVTGIGVHMVMVHFVRQWSGSKRTWRWKWTLSLVAIPIVLFAVCVSIQGAVTTSGWLVSSPLDAGHSRALRKLYARQLASFGKFIADEENQNHLPDSLLSIVAYLEEPLERGGRLYIYNDPEINDVPEYWTWLGGVRLNSPDDVPVAFSPRTDRNGARVVAFVDGTAKECTEEELQAALERWRQAVAKSTVNGATPEAN